MPTQPPLNNIDELRNLYLSEFSKLQSEFTTTRNGLECLQRRSELVQSIVVRMRERLAAFGDDERSRGCLIGLGRSWEIHTLPLFGD